MTISELKKAIEEQREENIRIFKIFEYKMHKEEMQPLLEQWREGSKHLKALLNKLYELEKEERKPFIDTTGKTFVNSFGEATTREITCNGYRRSESRIRKEVMSFIS